MNLTPTPGVITPDPPLDFQRYIFGVDGLFRRLTQGALADSRPWAVLCNPLYV